jgi:hypothetical protein
MRSLSGASLLIAKKALETDIVSKKHVFGVLPLHLACHAYRVTEVELDIPLDMRGKELSLEDVEKYAAGIHTYKVS